MRIRLVVAGLLVASAAPSAAPQQQGPARSRDDGIRAGLEWIRRAQNRDGSWGLDAQQPGDISCTVVAALALMAGGHTERGGPDPVSVLSVRRGLDYVLHHARRMTGDIWKGELTLVQNKLGQRIHTIFATVFLTQVYGMRGAWVKADEAEELRELIGRLTEFVIKTQEPDGSWHKDTFGSLKATCMAWLALRAAASSGGNVERASVDRTLRFIKAQYNPASKLFDRTQPQGNYQSIYATASCLRVLYAMGDGNSPEAAAATKAFMDFVRTGQMGAAFLTVEGEDYLSAALVTQALLIQEDPKRWNAWFPWISGELLRRQARDGSWTTTACISGRTFATSCALMTLQGPYRLLPIFEQ
jgi:hypothetical protein